MAALGALAQIVIFLPASGITLATGALILWLFAFGGMAGGAMTLLPTVVRDPARVERRRASSISSSRPRRLPHLLRGLRYKTVCIS